LQGTSFNATVKRVAAWGVGSKPFVSQKSRPGPDGRDASHWEGEGERERERKCFCGRLALYERERAFMVINHCCKYAWDKIPEFMVDISAIFLGLFW